MASTIRARKSQRKDNVTNGVLQTHWNYINHNNDTPFVATIMSYEGQPTVCTDTAPYWAGVVKLYCRTIGKLDQYGFALKCFTDRMKGVDHNTPVDRIKNCVRYAIRDLRWGSFSMFGMLNVNTIDLMCAMVHAYPKSNYTDMSEAVMKFCTAVGKHDEHDLALACVVEMTHAGYGLGMTLRVRTAIDKFFKLLNIQVENHRNAIETLVATTSTIIEGIPMSMRPAHAYTCE